MTLSQHITHAGIKPGDSYQLKRSLMLCNSVSILLSFVILFIFLMRITFLRNMPQLLTLGFLAEGILVFASPIILNRFGFTNMSRLVLCIGSLAFIWHIFITNMQEMETIETSIYAGLRIYVLALSPLPFLIFDRRKLSSELLTLRKMFCRSFVKKV